MMTDITLSVEQEMKTEAEKIFAKLGLSISDALKAFLRKSIEQGKVPFQIDEPQFNDTTLSAIQEARDIMSGKVQTKTYNSFAELLAEIDAEIAAEDDANAQTQRN